MGSRLVEVWMSACCAALAGCAASGPVYAPLQETSDDPPKPAVDAPLDEQEEPEEVWPTGDADQEEAEAQAAAGHAAAGAPATVGAGLVHGEVAAAYRYRAVDGEADHDVTSSVLLDVGDPDRHDWTGHLQGWMNWDLYGDSSDDAAFEDITDTWDDPVTARLYTAYVDYHAAERFDTVRLGRQELIETPAFVAFDGVRAETAEMGDLQSRFEAYGGVPAHFYESSSDGDLVFGLAASARPWDGGRVRLDWMHLEDEALLGDHVNDLFGLSAWQQVQEELRVDGRATMLEGEGRDVRLRATWVDPETELAVVGGYYILYEEQSDLVQELDPFTATLLTLEPFHRANVLATKPLREDLLVEGGYERRELLDSDDEGEFNRDFGRLHAAATALDLADKGVDLQVRGELWDATGSETTAWGLDLSREFDEELEAALGSYFALYKYDFLTQEERDNVRVYYADLEWHQTRFMTFDVRYEFENAPGNDYHLVRVGMRWQF